MSNLDELAFEDIAGKFKNENFRNPALLASTPLPPLKILAVGPCTIDSLVIRRQAKIDFVLFHGGLLPTLPGPAADYDAVICVITLRSLMRDDEFWRLPILDERAFESAHRKMKREMDAQFHRLATITERTGVPLFFLNFIVPTLNPNGRLMPGYSFSNIRHVLHELNRELELACLDTPNAYCIDLDSILNTYGKMYFTDEFTAWHSHNAFFGFPDDGQNGSRMEKTPHMVDHYVLLDTKIIADAVFKEVESQLRILSGVDNIKMIVVDLDDTLWRGVVGDQSLNPGELEPGAMKHLIEGWPLGVVEALMYCKKRGIILAVISKNDDALVRKVFPAIFGSLLSMQDFAATRINFTDKPQNMQEILEAVNILPSNVLYIDDNPVERARMADRFPDIRIVGKYFLYLRHLLLNAPETQVPKISAESSLRTEMLQGQLQRKSQAARLDPNAFLLSLNLQAKLFEITDIDRDPKALRAVELINKTNQWNSTGDKTSAEALKQGIAQGERLIGVSVADKFTHYGDVCFIRLHGGEIIQFVMSCRVAGLKLEQAILEEILKRTGLPEIHIHFSPTEKNLPFSQFVKSFNAIAENRYHFSINQLQPLTHVAFS